MNENISKSELEHLKMLSNKSIKKYVVMTIVGSAIFTIGLILLFVVVILMAANGVKGSIPSEYVPFIIIGTVLMAGPGTALMCVGTPCWISLGVQIKVARYKLSKLKK